MINHLKEIHYKLYLPRATDALELPFKVTPIDEPYLYTDANLYVDTFDNPNQSVKVTVSNIGGGTLHVDRIQIPRKYGRWVKRGKKGTPAALTTTSEPLEIELKLILKELPDPSSKNVAKLNLISNSKRKTFSKVLLGVRPPESQSPNPTLPEYINFGEITVWNVSLTDSRKDETKQTINFFLVGNFRLNPPTRLEITQRDEFSFDANFRLLTGELHYILDLRTPGIVMPRQKKTGLKLKSFRQNLPVANANRHALSRAVKSDTEWLTAPSEVHVEGYETTYFPVSVKVEKLKEGRNLGELVVSDKRIPVWVWYKSVRETTLTLTRNQPDIHYTAEFPTQGKPLPIEVITPQEPHQSVMIFEDVDFKFPLSEQDHTGYLMGDFNQWIPRTLQLEKTPKMQSDNFDVTLSIPDGTYLFRAEIDGEMRFDPRYLREIVWCSHGLASKIQIERHKQQITLRNKSRQRLKLRLQSSTEWLEFDSESILLPANKQRDISIVFLPEALQPGLNLGWIEIETTGESKRSYLTPIFVMGMTNGAVPILRNPEIEFPLFEQGKTADTSLALDIYGKGKLQGEIQPSTTLRFAEGDLQVKNESVFEPMKVAPLVNVLSDKPSNAYRKQCDAWLVTDCYLANRRLLPFTARYNMIHMISDPPALYFPKVFLFDEPQYSSLTVRRSDDRSIECTAEIPNQLAQDGFLKIITKNKKNLCQFVLNPQVLRSPDRFTGVIRLKDEKSRMTLPIRFATDIIGSRAKIDIENSNSISNLLSDGIPLVITNVGETELKIFDIRFKNLRFYYTPHLMPHHILHPGESIKMLVKVRKKITFFGSPLIRDTLAIKLNDPQFAEGIFEKEIMANIQGHFLNFR